MQRKIWPRALIPLLSFSSMALASGGDLQPMKIIAFSDFNGDIDGNYNPATKEAIRKMAASGAEIVLGVGDFIDGEKKNLSSSVYTTMWNSFTKWILSPLKIPQIPFLPTPGNHDAYYSNERSHYKNYWGQNKANVEYLDDSNYPFYYSFRQSNVFYVSLDDAKYESLYNRTTQLNWLKKQLNSPEAKAARARIVFGHIPLYSVATLTAKSQEVYTNGVIKRERLSNSKFSLEGVLLESQVDLVIFGHSHAYFGGDYVYPDGRELKVLSLPCTGGTQRYLLGTDVKSPYGYVEITLDASNHLAYQFYDYKGKLQSDRHLPTRIMLDAATKVEYFKKR